MSEIRKIPKGHYLYREGDVASEMYLVRTGAFAITRIRGAKEVKALELLPGEVVGEMALFDGKRRMINVKALEDSEVVVMPYEGLMKQMEDLPLWGQTLMKTLLKHLQAAIQKSKEYLDQAGTRGEAPSVEHDILKYLSIIHFVILKTVKDPAEAAVLPVSLFRDHAVQVFQEPTDKLNTILRSLVRNKIATEEKNSQGDISLSFLNPQQLIEFTEWLHQWLFKNEESRLPLLTESDLEIVQGLLHFASQNPVSEKGIVRVNLTEVQQRAPAELSRSISVDQMTVLAAKKYIPEFVMTEGGIQVDLFLDDLIKHERQCRWLQLFSKALS